MTLGVAQEADAQVGQDTVWRIVVAKGLTQAEAQDYKLKLEGLGFTTVSIAVENGNFAVQYGNFPNDRAAVREKDSLERAGLNPIEIVSVRRGGSDSQGNYLVVVQEFYDVRHATTLKGQLEREGYVGVDMLQGENAIQVVIGPFPSMDPAQNMLANLRERNFTQARIVQPQSASQRVAPAQVTSSEEAAIQEISPEIASSQIFRELTEEQRRKLYNTVVLQEKIRAGDDMAARMMELEKKIESLDTRTKEVYDLFQKQREEEAERTVLIGTLFRDAANLARGKRYPEAISKLREILSIDPTNQNAETRIRVIEGYMRGERYEGQEEEIVGKYEQLKEDADAAEHTMSPEGLQLAMNLWQDIKTLNPEKYGQEAANRINKIRGALDTLKQEEKATAVAAEKKQQQMYYALAGAVGFLGVIIALLMVRSRKRHRELMTKIHEITSIRPMRELEGAGAKGKLAGAAAGNRQIEQSESSLFGTPDDGDGFPGDPLAETFVPPTPPPDKGKDKKGKDKKGKAAPPPPPAEEEVAFEPTSEFTGPQIGGPGAADAFDDPFALPKTDKTSTMPTDDVFADFGTPETKPSPPPPPQEKKQEPAKAETGFDDVFSDLPAFDDTMSPGSSSSTSQAKSIDDTTGGFSMEDLFAEEKPKPKKPVQKTEESSEAISFGDLMGDSNPPAAAPEPPKAAAPPPAAPPKPKPAPIPGDVAPSDDDILAIFGETQTGAPPEPAAPKTPPAKPAAAAGANAKNDLTVDAPAEDPFAGTPFASIFDDADSKPKSGEQTKVTADSGGGLMPELDTKESSEIRISADDDTEIPAIKLDVPEDDPFASLSMPSNSGPVKTAPSAPKMAVSDPHSTTVVPQGASADGVVFAQNFEQDAVGQAPPNWSGEFPYATLTVRDDGPPKGSKKYIAYKKDEGVGKVYYCARFPNTSGIISVEFDLRCNDKNKFLLGFYIEKDEDFQQSIHTKILRSEAQTAPTIHIHGEPAPYLLGSWAHIRYVINLKESTVDGYIDSTHIARGLKLPQTPKYLNTLAIRDNINTTGDLCIANIQVKKMG